MKILLYKRHGFDAPVEESESIQEEDVPAALYNNEDISYQVNAKSEINNEEQDDSSKRDADVDAQPLENTLFDKTFDSNEDTAIPSILNPKDLVIIIILS